MTEQSLAQGSLIAILPQQGNLTKTAWELPATMTEGDWKSAGHALSQVEGAMNWWLGDWWRFGEHKYGDRKALVESDEWSGPAYQTCKNAALVSVAFEKSRRRDVVPFSHHAEVSSIADAEADQILDWCEDVFNKTGRVPTRVVLREKVKQVKAWLAQGWTQSQLERRKLMESGLAVVASKRNGDDGKPIDAALIAWADQQNLMVTIDRNTDWGNPFEMPADGNRDTVCDNYANHYLPFKPSLLKKINTLSGKVLVCWCHPERCHGDHLAHLANEVIS
jgi:hypothetical protein